MSTQSSVEYYFSNRAISFDEADRFFDIKKKANRSFASRLFRLSVYYQVAERHLRTTAQ